MNNVSNYANFLVEFKAEQSEGKPEMTPHKKIPDPGPLAGLKVLDLTRLLPGPFCTRLLGDWGADVLKVEDPHSSDYLRYTPPLVKEQSAYFLTLNRNKRSLVLDLKKEAGREVLRRLLETFDILVEGFRPGALERLDLGYAQLKSDHPRLIYASITGYGYQSIYRHRAGHDLNYCALAGGLSLNGEPNGRLVMPGFQAADLSGALYTALALLAAVLRRQQTNQGCFVDVSMTDCIQSLLEMQYIDYFRTHEVPRPSRQLLTGKFVCYNLYRTKDHRYMALGALEPKFWQAFCKATDKLHLGDEAYALAEPDSSVKQELDALFASRTQAEWTDLFQHHDCCCEPVLNLRESEHHPLFAADRFREVDHPSEGRVKELRPPIRFEPPAETTYRPAPAVDEHLQEVLTNAGYDGAGISDLQERGAFGTVHKEIRGSGRRKNRVVK